ncbi:nucleolar complex protein 2 homolog isoform X2 [Copidosoma floridanum]|uniref:nucleolar complex protein 2 homolog isoform X2 n=1 Tax=Copidosoma floridanum TaxID=29053 RepID=UPI000C6F5D66|nr:nucleolar complex protein 2 homolog isoform X2 [Copidosoma floridanum]
MRLKKGKRIEKMAKQHVARKKKKKNLADVTTDDFFEQDFENMDLSDDEEVDDAEDEEEESENVQSKDKKKQLVKRAKTKPDTEVDSDSSDPEDDAVAHRKSLMNLKETDPEFFNYLKQNDAKLLDFNADDDVASSADESESRHIPTIEDLEIASDESDFEPDDAEKTDHSGSTIKVTLQLIKTWQQEIQTDKSVKTIKNVVEAFHAALETVSDVEIQTTKYRVEGGAIFNGIVQLCVMQLSEALKQFLKVGDKPKFEAHKLKRFPKVKSVIKSYLVDLTKILESISSANIVTTLLKHLHQMLPFSLSFSSLRKPLLRILIKYWSTGEEEVIRVVAFLCIVKISLTNSAIFNSLLKTMYMKYVENARFVSPNTLAGINFMRRSLVELYLLNTDYSYTHAFMYVRQLAIHLRNALTLKKKEHFQTVYNWQYINSLWFWSELIALSKSESLLRNLLYPLVQITIGVVNLIPTMQYYPLRFHCVKMLINMSRETGVFIPSIPLVIELLDKYDFNKRHKAVAMKPLSLMCMLRVSKSQSRENVYKDALIENIYEITLENAAKDSSAIYFPDQYVFAVLELKGFLKKCKVANYCRKMKQLLEKIEENRKFIITERSKRTFDLFNLKEIDAWESEIKAKGTPLNKFYEAWLKVHEVQKMKMLTQNDEIAAEMHVPPAKKPKRGKPRPSDSDEDSDLEIPVEEMEKRLKKSAAKKAKKTPQKSKNQVESEDNDDDVMDVVQDIKDWD